MKRVLIIGATNIDIIAESHKPLNLYDKNPGKSRFVYGGVARNICENLARLETRPTFATIVGSDTFGSNALKYLEKLNTKVIYKTSTLPTSTFISILNNNNDNYISISSMDIIEHLNENFLKTIDYNKYDLIVADANSKSVIKFLTKINKPLFIDATSEAKVKNIEEYINEISYLKCTKEEMVKLFNNDSTKKIIEKHPQLSLIITNKDQDVIYNHNKDIFKYAIDKCDVISSVGAGDSFSAGFIYGLINEFDIHKSIKIAAKLAKHTVLTEDTVYTNLNKKLIEDIGEEDE